MAPPDDLPAPLRALLPGLVALTLAGTGAVVGAPDGWEGAWAARCLWGLDGGPLDCAAVDPGFRPPGLALLVGPLSLVLRPIVAMGVLSLAAVSLAVVPLGALGARLAGGPGRLAAAGLLVATPELASWAMVPDVRGPALLLTASAWALVLSDDRRALAAAGLLAGLGPLFRPELLAGVVLLPLAAVALHRRRSAPAAGGAAAGLAAALLLASLAAGRFVLAGRLWEGVVVQLGATVPLEWAKQLFGLGHWAPPMRALVAARGIDAPGALAGLSVTEGLAFLGPSLGLGLGLGLWILAGLGLTRAAAAPAGRRVLVVLAGLASAQAAAAALTQARNAALPLSNLTAPLAAGVVLAAAGAVALADAAPRPWRRAARWACAGAAVALAVASNPTARLLPGLERRPAGEAAVADLRDRVGAGEPVVASFATGTVALRAERLWVPWPAPWDAPTWPEGPGPRWALISSLDGGLPAAPPPGTWLEPQALYRGPGGWVAVAAVRSSAAAE